ncbi:MAG: PTS system mannose/fructose/sorbose family transporter subunit IID [Anaeromyxobacter sp.]|nr:PTS system mannose/fructose/sorbose family transporter subunit IID [Anaeromyxobacter sp.]MBL0278153.1 PTS system mannose/fructose/sorbose family transporter subunit IID [Anaeromyxobacter sp.]
MRLRQATLLRVFWRCLFLQAAWNRRGMQNLGFAYAIDPALRALYADPVAREEALQRHLGFFNCHPYMAAAILGGAIHHEEKVAAGQEPGAAPLTYKATLQGPLAAVGDGFFWTALRPFFGAVAAVGALTIGWPAVVAALLAYNLIHASIRWGLFRAGYEKGDGVVADIARLALPRLADRLRLLGAVLCGAAAGLLALAAVGGQLAVSGGTAGGPLAGAVGAAGAAAVALGAALGYLALARGVPLFPVVYAGAAAAAVAAMALGGRWNGGS